VHPISVPKSLPDYFTTLEEVLQSGENFCADKIVYLEKFTDWNDDPFRLVSKVNVDLDRWIEFNVWLCGEREPHYTGVIRPAGNGRHIGWKSYRHLGTRPMYGNPAMLVDVPEPMQLPQFSQMVSIPVSVWLKETDDRFRAIGNTKERLIEKSSPLCVTDRDDRKAGLVVSGTTRSERESTSDMVQSRSHATYCVASSQSNLDANGCGLKVNDVLASFKIILGPSSIRLALQKFTNLRIKRVQVTLRPTEFEAGVELWV